MHGLHTPVFSLGVERFLEGSGPCIFVFPLAANGLQWINFIVLMHVVQIGNPVSKQRVTKFSWYSCNSDVVISWTLIQHSLVVRH